MANTTSATLQLSNLVEGTYVFGLTVTDDDGATGYDQVTVVVSPEPVNIPPNVTASNDMAISLPTSSVNLTCTANDSDGTITSFLWEKVSGPSATIGSPNVANTTVSGLIAGNYVFKITVTDNDGLLHSKSSSIEVKPACYSSDPLFFVCSRHTLFCFCWIG